MSLVIAATVPALSAPLHQAVAWIGGLQLNFMAPVPNGVLTLSVNADAQAAIEGRPPVRVDHLVMGRDLPSLAELMADPEFASAFGTMRTKLYAALLASGHYPGAIDVGGA
jgi:hypothetical protein